jgi:hypothetical protein
VPPVPRAGQNVQRGALAVLSRNGHAAERSRGRQQFITAAGPSAADGETPVPASGPSEAKPNGLGTWSWTAPPSGSRAAHRLSCHLGVLVASPVD